LKIIYDLATKIDLAIYRKIAKENEKTYQVNEQVYFNRKFDLKFSKFKPNVNQTLTPDLIIKEYNDYLVRKVKVLIKRINSRKFNYNSVSKEELAKLTKYNILLKNIELLNINDLRKPPRKKNLTDKTPTITPARKKYRKKTRNVTTVASKITYHDFKHLIVDPLKKLAGAKVSNNNNRRSTYVIKDNIKHKQICRLTFIPTPTTTKLTDDSTGKLVAKFDNPQAKESKKYLVALFQGLKRANATVINLNTHDEGSLQAAFKALEDANINPKRITINITDIMHENPRMKAMLNKFKNPPSNKVRVTATKP